MISRRGFLGLLVGGVAAAVAVREFPFRVFSFPEKIIIPEPPAANALPVLGFNFYDLRGPAKWIYPMNMPLRNMLPRYIQLEMQWKNAILHA